MNTVKEQITELISHAETIKNDGDHDLSNMEIGDEWRQGDVRIVRLPDDFDASTCTPDPSPSLQLVAGNTLGSRHCLSTLKGVTMYRLRDATVLDGPVIHTAQPIDVLHPEHGNCRNLPAGWYAFPGQRSYAAELRRTLD